MKEETPGKIIVGWKHNSLNTNGKANSKLTMFQSVSLSTTEFIAKRITSTGNRMAYIITRRNKLQT